MGGRYQVSVPKVEYLNPANADMRHPVHSSNLTPDSRTRVCGGTTYNDLHLASSNRINHHQGTPMHRIQGRYSLSVNDQPLSATRDEFFL